MALPGELPLTPLATRQLARAVALESFDRAAELLNEDWHAAYDGKQLQRWGERLGARLAGERDAEVRACASGGVIPGPPNPPALLVIQPDGGRVQMREANAEGSRWREDKIAAVVSYLPGDGSEANPPRRLVSSYAATLGDVQAFGPLLQVEATRRGVHHAQQVLVLGDCAAWIDTVARNELPEGYVRIADYSHASEHLHTAAKAVHGAGTPQARALGEAWEGLLWQGRIEPLIGGLARQAQDLGAPRKDDGPEHPRRIVAETVGYFRKHGQAMDYPAYRARGWPIGSGVVEGGVKQFNKRVKGSEQFWTPEGAEAILSLRALYLSKEDGRWDRYWSQRPAYLRSA